MTKVLTVFHYLSFIKYPLLLLALYFVYWPIISGNAPVPKDLNNGLIFMGIGVGLDSLKDYRKLNWLDRQVLHKPKRAKYYFIVIGLIILSFIVMGLQGYFSAEDHTLKDVSMGLLIFGIGMIGFLKTGLEVTKNYMESHNP